MKRFSEKLSCGMDNFWVLKGLVFDFEENCCNVVLDSICYVDIIVCMMLLDACQIVVFY